MKHKNNIIIKKHIENFGQGYNEEFYQKWWSKSIIDLRKKELIKLKTKN